MTPYLLSLLCDPETGDPLLLSQAEHDTHGNIISGHLTNRSGRVYPITRGVPRFVSDRSLTGTVNSFGDEWNYFNFTEFKLNWMQHTVRNTFGDPAVFSGKVIVDAGGGSGAQTLWMLESGARHVILLELSHSVDGVIAANLGASRFRNYDVVQCSIDKPPIRPGSVDGMVICHNVIQHTPSVERTAAALFAVVGQGGEFVFNCYPRNDQGLFRWIRFHLIYQGVRLVLSRMPFWVILAYARFMGLLRLLPGLGLILEKSALCVQGDVPRVEGTYAYLKKRYRSTVLNTFDAFGSHAFQHHKSDRELLDLVSSLQPDRSKVKNLEKYFSRPQPIGCALRLFR